jgi:hypothetical protein
MPTFVLTWTARDIIEVVIATVLMLLVMGAMAAIPFIAEYYVDDRRPPEEP